MKKMMVFLVIAILTVGVSATALAGPVEWKAQTVFAPDDSSTVIQAQGVADVTNKALKGQLETTLYQCGQLVPAEEMTPALARGVYDAAAMVPMMRSNAGVVAFGLPFGLKGIDQIMEFWYDYGFLDFMRKVDAKKGIRFGCPLPFGPVTLLSKFPVRKLDDMKGKKVWAEGPLAHLAKALGAEPVWFDPGEVYMGLKLGTIDGVFFGVAELETMKLKEVVKYVMSPAPIDILVCDWVISERSWKKLTPEMQAAYEKAMKDNVVDQFNRCTVYNNKGLEAGKAAGVEVIEISAEELPRFRAAAMKVWNVMKEKDDQSAQAVKMVEDYLKSKGIEPGK